MSAVVKWWSRFAAAMTGAALTLVVPVHAWAASNGVDGVVTEGLKYRRRRTGLGVLGLFGGVCCLLVVAVIVLIVVLIFRRRRK